MRHLRTVSYVITAAGVLAVAASAVAGLSPTVLLLGLMLIIAGMVKIVIVALWHGVAGFGVPATEEPAAASVERRSSARQRRGRL